MATGYDLDMKPLPKKGDITGRVICKRESVGGLGQGSTVEVDVRGFEALMLTPSGGYGDPPGRSSILLSGIDLLS
jgi:hypothetical protein